MSYIQPLTPEQATGTTAEQYGTIKGMLGVVPNMMQTMAQSPAVLSGYLALSGALGKGVLKPALREKIALAVAQTNDCNYCLAAHTAIGAGLNITESDNIAARQGHSTDPKDAAILTFAQAVSNARGAVSEADWNAVRGAGISDAEAAQTIAEVALNVLTNYFNNATEPVLDFPAAPAIP